MINNVLFSDISVLFPESFARTYQLYLPLFRVRFTVRLIPVEQFQVLFRMSFRKNEQFRYASLSVMLNANATEPFPISFELFAGLTRVMIGFVISECFQEMFISLIPNSFEPSAAKIIL